jgi:hypothetical protein
MKRRTPHTLVLFAPLLTSRLALADASYQESVQITGGQLVETLRSVPFLPKSMKQLLDPLKTTKMVHGNQYASVSPQSTEIIDLDQETVTRIDHDKKTYSVTTFAQMRQALQDSAKKVQQATGEDRGRESAAAGRRRTRGHHARLARAGDVRCVADRSGGLQGAERPVGQGAGADHEGSRHRSESSGGQPGADRHL